MTTQAKPTPQTALRWRLLRQIAFVAGGAALGFAYYFFVGCQSGTCPLTSSPYLSTAYGGLVGFLFGRS